MVILGLMITGLDLKLLCFIDLLLYLRQNTFELNQVLTSACAGQTYWNTLVNIVINISVFFFCFSRSLIVLFFLLFLMTVKSFETIVYSLFFGGFYWWRE